MRRMTLFVAAAALLTYAGAAQAHAKLTASNPAANATVVSPAHITLGFSEKLVEKFSGADLAMIDMPGMKMNASMKMTVKTTLAADGKTMMLMPAKRLTPGTYKLDYHAVTSDTHRINGSYSFKVK